MKSSNSNLRRYIYYFGFAMVIVYVCLGLLLIFYDVPIDVPRNREIIVGVLLVTYGLTRAYFKYRNRKNDPQYNDDILDRDL